MRGVALRDNGPYDPAIYMERVYTYASLLGIPSGKKSGGGAPSIMIGLDYLPEHLCRVVGVVPQGHEQQPASDSSRK